MFANLRLDSCIGNKGEKGSNLKTCNLELLKYTKFITRCYKCPNEQVRNSIASYG
jgi:hypothetical protein